MATYKLVDEEKLDAAMTATADAIRAKTGSTDPIAWDSEKGMSEAVEPVFEAGKKAEYDAFWDALQNAGEKKPYGTEFQSPLWTNENFRPKYDVYPTNFTFSQGGDPPKARCNIEDMRKSTLGVNIDWSLCENFNMCLRDVPVKYIDTIDMANAMHGWTVLFDCLELISVEKVILPPQSSNIIFSTHGFGELPALTEIRFEGYFWGSVSINASTMLSRDSIMSAFAALAPDITDAGLTLSTTAVDTAFETSPGAADGSTSEEWAALIATKPNWTIVLADA